MRGSFQFSVFSGQWSVVSGQWSVVGFEWLVCVWGGAECDETVDTCGNQLWSGAGVCVRGGGAADGCDGATQSAFAIRH
ncbi:MAG: hypothetical protein RIT02_2364, partial [Planctomycetota bacterium]